MSEIEWLATKIGRPDVERLNEREVALRILDTVGALVAGAGTEEGQMLLAMRRQEREAAGAFGQADVDLDLIVRCALARLSEVDDIHRASMMTPGAVVIPAVLTLAGESGADVPTTMAAIDAGYEAMIRLGRGVDGPAILARGIWPTYLATPFAVAAAAARLWGLDPVQTAHALALAFCYAAPAVGRPAGAATSRWLAVGQAVKNGLAAANAARFGFVGDLSVLQDETLANTRGLTFDAEAFRADPEVHLMSQVSFKPWCAAKQTMSASHALRVLMPADPNDVADVTVRIPPVYAGMISHQPAPANRSSHLTSLRHQMALAALAPDAMCDVNQCAGGQSARLDDFSQRIRVETADDLQHYYPARYPADVSLVTRSGETRSARMLSAPGDPELPMSESQVVEKFERLVTDVVRRPCALLQAGQELLARPQSVALLLGTVEMVLQQTDRCP
ncbi:MAG: MmgE/PrpD family protein [Xanthobacteraceae bacterium]